VGPLLLHAPLDGRTLEEGATACAQPEPGSPCVIAHGRGCDAAAGAGRPAQVGLNKPGVFVASVDGPSLEGDPDRCPQLLRGRVVDEVPTSARLVLVTRGPEALEVAGASRNSLFCSARRRFVSRCAFMPSRLSARNERSAPCRSASPRRPAWRRTGPSEPGSRLAVHVGGSTRPSSAAFAQGDPQVVLVSRAADRGRSRRPTRSRDDAVPARTSRCPAPPTLSLLDPPRH
jgi:hypothetical protein